MNTRIQAGAAAILMVLFVSTPSFAATPQWQPGQLVSPAPRYATYFSMRLGTNSAPLPALPPTFDGPVYFVGSFDGIYVFCFDDINYSGRSSQQNSEDNPLLPDGDYGGDWGGWTNFNYPEAKGYDYGTNLFIMIGPASANQAWLAASNTHHGVFYQLESRNTLADFAATPWALGQIVQDSAGTNQVRFGNVRKDNPSQQYFRAVGGSMIASITVDPDYNLAVEPTTQNGSPQIGKFHVTLSPSGSSGTVVYQVSGLASNGVDHTTLSGSVSVSSSGPAEIDIQPLFDNLPEFDESVTLTLVPHTGNGYLVQPQQATATLKIYDPRPTELAVAIHDSGWTRKVGLSSTNWNYFVMPESVKEALRSDGTPYAVVSDLDIANGFLLDSNNVPRYPILISLAAEAIRDEEIAPLTNYVARGGFLLVGSSSFTRSNTGAARPNFALASQMGLICSPSATNWADNTHFFKQTEHRLVDHISPGWLKWRMPASAEEISWSNCTAHPFGYDGPHQIWQTWTNGADVLAYGWNGVAVPYLAVSQHGNGRFIYHAAMQPLMGHGGFAPGMYAYVILRRAIEWAFESAQRPVAKLSPWPYDYQAAFIVRHDFESTRSLIEGINQSALYEKEHGAKGDYYFCTGRISPDLWNYETIMADLRTAVGSNGATIGPHNGGLPNPRSSCNLFPEDYDYWHWGLDEALDLPGGKEYARNSLATAFAQLEGWLTNVQTGPRLWASPYFNATRDDSYDIQEQLGVKIAGEQKLTPFPHWTLSTRTDGKRYSILSQPASEWYVNGLMAQSLEGYHEGTHDLQSMRDAVDFYYGLGALVNLYSHTLSTGSPGPPNGAGDLVPNYIEHCTNLVPHPRIWAANAKCVYDWWLQRSTARVTASYATNGSHSVAEITVSGASSADTAVEILAVGLGSAVPFRVLRNGAEAGTNDYWRNGERINVRIGTTVTNAQIEYGPGPQAQNDAYTASQDQPLTVGQTHGVLINDWAGDWSGLAATPVAGPSHGSLSLDTTGAFTYTPDTNFFGTDCFTYEATDGSNPFGTAVVTILVVRGSTLFRDDFARCTAGAYALWPWQTHWGSWACSGGVVQGSRPSAYGYCYYDTDWTDYSVETKFQFAAGAYGGGLGGRLDPATGAHYAAWVYPSWGNPGTNLLKVVKFSDWDHWGYHGTNNQMAMAVTNLPSVGTDWHALKLAFQGSQIRVYYDYDTNSPPLLSVTDADTVQPPCADGGVSLDLWDALMRVDDVIVTP